MSKEEAEALAAFINEHDPRHKAVVVTDGTSFVQCYDRTGGEALTQYHSTGEYIAHSRYVGEQDHAFAAALEKMGSGTAVGTAAAASDTEGVQGDGGGGLGSSIEAASAVVRARKSE